MQKKTILVLDDVDYILDSIKDLLESNGYNAVTANNKLDFFQKLTVQKVDLILLDVVMPGTDGYKICQKLKSNPVYKGIPVIFITSLMEEKNIIRGLEVGADDFITKPFSNQVFLLRIKAVLNQYLQKEKYKLIAENISDIVWKYDLDMKPVYVSPSVYKVRGVTVEEALNLPIEETFPPESLAIAHKILNEKKTQIEKRDPQCWETFNVELKLYKKDKSTFWAHLTVQLVKGKDGCPTGFLGVTRDITKEVEAKKALKESEVRYRSLFEKSKDPIALLAGNGFVDCNDATLQALKIKSKKDFINLQPWDISPHLQPDGRSSKEKAKEMNKTGLTKGCNSFEWVLKDTSNKKIWFHVSMTKIIIDNKEILHTIWRDISKEKKAEKELLDTKNEQIGLNEKLKAINDELHEQKEFLEKTQQQLIQTEKMASLGILSAGVAHEINNPLNYISSGLIGLKKCVKDLIGAVKGFEGLSTDKLVENYQEYKTSNKKQIERAVSFSNKMVENIEFGVDKAAEIVKAMRSFSKSSEKEFTVVNLNQVIDSVLVILHNSYKHKLEIEKDYCKDASITGVSGKLHQAIMNLLANAIQATPRQGKITICTKWDNKQDKLILKIKDTGEGISDEIKSNVFDPFFTTKNVGEGTGLGLYITYNIIEQHRGSIAFESETDQGTEFTIHLPKNRK